MFGYSVLDTAYRNLYRKVAAFTSISEASKEITPGEVRVYTADGMYLTGGEFILYYRATKRGKL